MTNVEVVWNDWFIDKNTLVFMNYDDLLHVGGYSILNFLKNLYNIYTRIIY